MKFCEICINVVWKLFVATPPSPPAPPGLNDRHHVTCRTPLHEAAMSSCTSMVALLLAAGADPNIPHPTQVGQAEVCAPIVLRKQLRHEDA